MRELQSLSKALRISGAVRITTAFAISGDFNNWEQSLGPKHAGRLVPADSEAEYRPSQEAVDGQARTKLQPALGLGDL
jgi:hypothetical protein